MVKSLEIKWLESFKENNIDLIIGGPYNSQHQWAVEAFNKAIKVLISAKDHQKKKFV